MTAHEISPLLQAIAEVDAAAWGHLTSAFEDGQAELNAADPNDVWNVTARFVPRTGQFGASNREGQPSLSHDCFPSDIIKPPHPGGILEAVAMGHGDVVVIVSMVLYLRAGHETSLEALARTLLREAQRVVDLGLRVDETTHKLLEHWRDTHPE
ncbi:hypothetical protein [Deinococcus hohokamensis]|uniref:Uncharacterized protein n=1 Tax=Deinococcus hohokamensis TaxID=309883 RepID=A0ABV9I654_9DEIO